MSEEATIPRIKLTSIFNKNSLAKNQSQLTKNTSYSLHNTGSRSVPKINIKKTQDTSDYSTPFTVMDIAKIKYSIQDELNLKTNLTNLFGSNSYRPLLD